LQHFTTLQLNADVLDVTYCIYVVSFPTQKYYALGGESITLQANRSNLAERHVMILITLS